LRIAPGFRAWRDFEQLKPKGEFTVSIATERTTRLAKCNDCAQGILEPVRAGFNLYRDTDGQDQFWYCAYCGSNHVTLIDEEGNEIEVQGNLYAPF
jgi:hypothetical protein